MADPTRSGWALLLDFTYPSAFQIRITSAAFQFAEFDANPLSTWCRRHTWSRTTRVRLYWQVNPLQYPVIIVFSSCYQRNQAGAGSEPGICAIRAVFSERKFGSIPWFPGVMTCNLGSKWPALSHC